jgi:alginate O-acetyltransferase complex protein AlgI
MLRGCIRRMLFNSYVFLLVFLPLTLAVFYGLSGLSGARAAKAWLIVASLVYYGWWNPFFVLLLLLSMLFNFSLGRWMAQREGSRPPLRALLIFGLTVNLLLLGYYKYANFFVENVDQLLGASWTLGKIILPLGISFFTFQQVTYLVDASRGIGREYDPVDYILFVSFFPHSIAGPIVHHQEMMPQFARAETYRFQWENLAVGLSFFAAGLCKKTMVADVLSGHATKVFDAAAAGTALGASDAWAGVLSYTFEIYFDFSGYCDMALGLARMFGITLPLNFNSPYKAASCIEFWHRWHMTLSRCMRDYLYIPMGGSRRGETRRYGNLMLTMLIGGIWHGAGWTFVLWGLFHGGCLAVNHLWDSLRGAHSARPASPARVSVWAGRALTFFLVIIGWVFFRAAGLGAARHLLAAMFHLVPGPPTGAPLLLKSKTWIWLVGLTAFVWSAPNMAELLSEFRPALNPFKGALPQGVGWLRWRMTPCWAALAATLLAASILSLSNTGEFLYYNF